MAGYWTFRDYVNRRGENEIHSWLDSLPKRAKVRINTTISRLELMETLGMPHIKKLTGPCDGLLELRVLCENVQYRPLCAHGPGEREVTLLVGAIEKGGRLPSSACSTALARKQQLGQKGSTCDHDFS